MTSICSLRTSLRFWLTPISMWVLVSALVLGLSSCGKKGGLYPPTQYVPAALFSTAALSTATLSTAALSTVTLSTAALSTAALSTTALSTTSPASAQQPPYSAQQPLPTQSLS